MPEPRHLLRRLALLAGLLALPLTGCAQFPTGIAAAGARTLVEMKMTVRGSIDPNGYYLFVIDSNSADNSGPVVIAPFTQFLGNGRATGAYDHYVEFHLGQFELFADQPETQGQTVPPRVALGSPFYYDSTSSSGTLSCSVDLNTLKTNAGDPAATQLKINMITVNRILLPGEVSTVVRQSDGLGTDGTNYLIVQMQAGTVIQNTGIEAAGEIFEGQQLTPAFDLVDFQIAVKQGS